MSGCPEYRRMRRYSRREMLRVGALAGLGGLGLSLADVLRAEDARRNWRDVATGAPGAPGYNHTPKAKSVILLWLQGGVTHHETFDPKPAAPEDIRGEFGVIPTSIPGERIGELMPLMAKRLDRIALIRSATHPEAGHERGMSTMLTGRRPIRPGNDPSGEFPDVGAMVAYQLGMRQGVPPYVQIPGTDFTAARNIYGNGYLPATAAPFRGRDADVLSPGVIGVDRFERRRDLYAQLDRTPNQAFGANDPRPNWDAFNERAIEIIDKAAAHNAFDLSQESPATFERYGIEVDAQRKSRRMQLPELCLLSRRLVEAGVRFVTIGRDSWDHHSTLFAQCKSRVPRFDRAFASLLDDLDERNMLDETLVVYLTEFGRTPKVNKDAGRDHWPNVFSIAFAGAGIKRGVIVGSSDKDGGYPASQPVTPPQVIATILHLAGIDPQTTVTKTDGRPISFVHADQPIADVLA